MKATIYLRVSDAKLSTENQKQACIEYCNMKNYEVVSEYIDIGEARTGTENDRPNFQQMIKDSATGRFDKIIAYTVDRFSRNTDKIKEYTEILKNNGVQIEYVKNPEQAIIGIAKELMPEK